MTDHTTENDAKCQETGETIGMRCSMIGGRHVHHPAEGWQPTEKEVTVEWGLRDSTGYVYTGHSEGVRWTREQADYARDEGDTLICRPVIVTPDVIGEWYAPPCNPPAEETR